MNQEIYSILDDIKKHAPGTPLVGAERDTYLSIQTTRLLVLLAEEGEKSSDKNEKATKRIVFLTWVIVVLTTVLVLTVFFDFPKVTIKFGKQHTFSTEKDNKDSNNKTIQPLPESAKTIPNVNK